LHFGTAKRSTYLASLQWGLPGKVYAVKNNYIGTLSI
jgi:hypothetical protein